MVVLARYVLFHITLIRVQAKVKYTKLLLWKELQGKGTHLGEEH